jgi:hypothetical protein
MIRDRKKQITKGLVLSIAIALFAFYLEGQDLDMTSTITGYSVQEHNDKDDNLVILKGLEIKAVIEGKTYYYLFSENTWYESKQDFQWDIRPDMGTTISDGLYYLESYDAQIYFRGEKFQDAIMLARLLE